MTTNGYAAKRAIIGRLQELAALAGGPLAGLQVAYAWPGATVQLECVYGGGIVFDQPADGASVAGHQRLVKENAQVSIHIRVAKSPPPPNGIEDTDMRAEAIGEAIGAELALNPQLAGGLSVSQIVGGQGDYSSLDNQAVSTLSYRISVESYLEQ